MSSKRAYCEKFRRRQTDLIGKKKMTAKHLNKKITILLADRNKDNLRLMRECFNQADDFIILGCAFDGRQLLELINELEPDLLLIDLILPKLDCLTVLEELAANGYKKDTKIIVTSEVWLDFLLRKAGSLGIDQILIKPLEKEAILRRARKIMLRQTQASTFLSGRDQCAYDMVTRYIRTVGITANVKGYQYLREAILLVQDDFCLINRLSKQLYVMIAAKYGSTPARVQRAIRHAIGAAWDREEAKELQSFLGFAIIERKGRPSNGAFIAMLADKLNTELSKIN